MAVIVAPKDTDRFARIQDGVIIEVPVLYLHIKNRHHPLSWYVPIIESAKPDVFDYQFTKPEYELINGFVHEKWTVINYPLDALLIKIRTAASPGKTPKDAPAVDIHDLKPEVLKQVMSLIVSLATTALNDWAAAKGYDDINTLISYTGSSNPVYVEQAKQGLINRDRMWAALETYQSAIVMGTKKVPVNQAEVEENFPALIWQ